MRARGTGSSTLLAALSLVPPLALLIATVLATAAAAQDPATGTHAGVVTPLVAPDSSPLFERPNGGLVRAGVAVFDLTLVRDGQPVSLGTRTVEVVESQLGGAPAWLIAESRRGSAVTTSDSLWLRRADFSPARWVSAIGPAMLGASFSTDTMFGAVQSLHGRSSFVTPMLPGALVTAGMVERLLELLPLHAEYRASASLMLVDQGTPRALLAELRVQGAARVRVGGAEHDCWVVALRAGVMEERLWVTRTQPRVVRTEQAVSGGLLVGERRQ